MCQLENEKLRNYENNTERETRNTKHETINNHAVPLIYLLRQVF